MDKTLLIMIGMCCLAMGCTYTDENTYSSQILISRDKGIEERDTLPGSINLMDYNFDRFDNLTDSSYKDAYKNDHSNDQALYLEDMHETDMNYSFSSEDDMNITQDMEWDISDQSMDMNQDLAIQTPQVVPSFEVMNLLIDLERKGQQVWAHFIYANHTQDSTHFPYIPTVTSVFIISKLGTVTS